METGGAIDDTNEQAALQGAGCAGSVGNRIGQLDPCAWRLGKQPGVVQGCRNGGELASGFLARGTGST